MMISPQSRPALSRAPRACGTAFVFGALALCTAACSSRPFQAPNPQPEGQKDQFYDVNPIRDLDLLVLVDNSGSMAQEQANLRKNFGVLIDTLRQIPGGLPNVNIAVISSDVGAGDRPNPGNPACNPAVRPGGDRGQFRSKETCGLMGGSRFITSYNQGTQNNFSGQLSDVFSCIADLGIGGCGFEHQLQSIRVALSESVEPSFAESANKGFLRRDAYLAIVMLTDEDDCSAVTNSDLFVDTSFEGQAGSLRCNIAGHICDGKAPPAGVFRTDLANCTSTPRGRLIPVEEVASYVKGLKTTPEKVIVSAITGLPGTPQGAKYAFLTNMDGELDVEPICAAEGGTAAPSPRIEQFVKAFGQNGSLHSICSGDFSPALKRIGELIALKLNPGCIDARLIDTDPAMAGVQPECTVVDRLPNGADFDETVIPECGKGGPPCWRLQAAGEGGNTCPNQPRVQVDRGGREATPGTLQAVKCRTCERANDPRCP